MIIAQPVLGHLSQTEPEEEEVELPDAFVARYKYLERADKALNSAFESLTAIGDMSGGLPSEYAALYNEALDNTSTVVQRVFDEYNSLEGTIPREPSLPPRAVVEASSSGLGFVPITSSAYGTQSFIPASRLRFVFTNPGGGTSLGTLADAIEWQRNRYEQGELGVNVVALAVIGFICGYAFTAYLVSRIKEKAYTTAAKIEAVHAAAIAADMQNRSTQAVMNAYEVGARTCSRKSSTVDQLTKCLSAAGAAAAKAGKSVPKVPISVIQPAEKKMGFLAWTGLIALGAGTLAVGFWIYEKKRARRALVERYR